MQVIKNINLYLVKNYPIIWNTRFVWMMLVIFALHIISFLTGLLATGTERLMEYSHELRIYFSGIFQIQLIIAVLALVFWIIAYFRNNALKSRYPVSYWSLLKEFLIQFVVFFGLISFYFTMLYGQDVYVKTNFNPETLAKEAHIHNKAQAFIPKKQYDYHINNRAYPKIYDSLIFNDYYDTLIVCRLNSVVTKHSETIGYNPTLTSEAIQRHSEKYDIVPGGFVIFEDSLLVYKYGCKETIDYDEYSILNYNQLEIEYYYKEFPELLQDFGIEALSSYEYLYDDGILSEISGKKTVPTNHRTEREYSRIFSYRCLSNKWVIEFVERNDPQEFDELMRSYLAILNKYKIGNNLSLDMLRMIYSDNVKSFTYTVSPYHTYSHGEDAMDMAVDSNKISDLNKIYVDDYKLENLYRKTHKAFFSSFIDHFELNILLLSALALTLILLVFRSYSWRVILFAIVTFAIVVIISFIVSLWIFSSNILNDENIILGYCLLSILFMLAGWLPLFANKLRCGVISVLSLIAVPITLLLVCIFLDECTETSIDTFDTTLWSSYFVFCLLYILIYLIKIRRWQAMPDSK
ncbi:MAG: hypothetical protein ACK5IQ_03720 [Bacteroidales bacterium]